jgi:acyl carrier protein
VVAKNLTDNYTFTLKYHKMNPENIKEKIRDYILNTVTKNEGSGINDDTLLMSAGIMDSITTLKLVDFLEKTFDIEFQPHEVDKENLNSIDLITEFILSKK